MLTHLHISNFALIDELDLSFEAGFAVITGETGAGKSILLGAMALLSGVRGDVKTIKEGANKCVVEAQFAVDDALLDAFLEENDIDLLGGECLLRREITAAGKSRAFVNDTPTTLALLRDVALRLIDIHSQHQNLLLKDDSFQLSVVDTIADDGALLAAYKDSYKAYRAAEERLARTQRDLLAQRANIDFLRYQYDELSRLNLQEGEEEQLSQQVNTMQHAEDIKGALYAADEHLSDEQTGVLTRLHRCLSALAAVATVFPQGEEVQQRIESAYIELKDVAADLSRMADTVDYDAAAMERLTARLDAIYTLERKHHVSGTTALLALAATLRATIEQNDNSEEVLAALEQQRQETARQCHALAEELTARRQQAAKQIEEALLPRLQRLGLPTVQFAVSLAAKPLSGDGKDSVVFLFSANVGVPLRPISAVASGGEVARVMLAVKALLGSAMRLPTVIFDEIDTGVSGRVAEQVAAMMVEMSGGNRQVVSITHLPQIAAFGTAHYKVYKCDDGGTTVTRVCRLTAAERVDEIAQLLSGSEVSAAARSNAEALLSRAQQATT